ncbi:MAG: ThuA domain-containing protein [Phycisphaerales bacterium]|nr:ThuA domain-containing protein [Phycisphaerales bacterium]
MKRVVQIGLVVMVFAGMGVAQELPRVLVFSKTAGFRHGCIEPSVKAMQEISEGHFIVEATEDSSEFTPGNLSRFDAVVFMNTTQDVLDETQQAAFEEYLLTGGGYVGVHAAADTEYDWPFYGKLLGGAWFKTHPAVQEATVIVEDGHHPTMSHLPEKWVRTDEWYEYRANPRDHVHVLASLDESTYQVRDGMGDHPIVWTTPVGKGAAIYTGGGHTDESFSEPAFREHLLRSVHWAIDDGWIDLVPATGLDGWTGSDEWINATSVAPASDNPKALAPVTHDGHGGVMVNGDGHVADLRTATDFGDVEVHVEFMVPEGSNSGVYLQDRYEVQILDSWGKLDPQHDDCGGIYQRWDDNREPRGYEGRPPRVNAARKPGHWQTYDIVFRAPRFDADGKKIANARFERVVHNGIVVHEDVELTGYTRAGNGGPEVAVGPLRLQGDHGPVAYRNIRIRRIDEPGSH